MNLGAAYFDVLWQRLPLFDLTGHNNDPFAFLVPYFYLREQ